MAVFRIYVEKKNKFATEAESLTEDIRSFLEIPGVSSLRIINRYDVEGIDGDLFEKCKDTVFSDPQTDHIYYELPESDHVFAAEYLPGQYDQRADSCAQCIQFISLENRPAVRTAKIYLLFGSVTEKELGTIKDYIINPVERREVSLSAFESLEKPIKEPENVAILRGFRDMKNDEADEFLSSHNLAMDRDDLIFCRGYFISEGRDPSYTEIRMIDTYWSDHCRHTTFLTEIQSASIEDNRVKEAYESYQNMRLELRRENKPVTLMDIATIGAKYLKHKGILTTLDESEEVNACSVRIDVDVDGKTEPWLLMFKNETHNHPTEIEPFGGASTCLGGAIRDPLSGRSYVYQAMRITGAANPLDPLDTTLPGKLPQRTIVTEAAAGYSSYGNQIGLAAGLVKEIYHPGYAAKRLEMGAVVAATPASHVIREVPKPGDVIILLGGKTGRDGCGGATGSSKSHDSSSLESGGAEVQKGNAPEERKIQRLFRKKNVARLIKRCNDFGAGGVSVAVGELADSINIDLDAVPAKYPGLDGTELAISESQERMAVVVSKKDVGTFIEQAADENLEATPIAEVTDTGRLIMFWRGEEIVNLKRSFLDSNGAPKYTDVEVLSPKCCVNLDVTNFIDTDKRSGDLQPGLIDLQRNLEDLVGNLNYCSQKGLVQIFDSTAGGGTVLMPLGGIYQETPAQAMVSKIPVSKGHTTTCSAASWGFNPYLTEADPYLGSYLAVIDSVAKLVACGGDLDNCWLSFQEYFERLGNNAASWGKPFSALLGALKAQTDLGIAAIGGKDSMSGSFEDLHVPPTLISVAVSLCNSDDVISPEFKGEGNRIILLTPEYGDSQIPVRNSLIDNFNAVSKLIKGKKALSVSAITSGGVAEALFKMSLGNKIGIKFTEGFNLSKLFKSYYGGFVVELDPLAFSDLENEYELLGTTIDKFHLISGDENIDLAGLRDIYNNRLEPIFPTKPRKVSHIPKLDLSDTVGEKRENNFAVYTGPNLVYGKPKVLIPVFPGTSGEYDVFKAMDAAGGNCEMVVVKNQSPADVKESVKRISDEIRTSQIIVFPGGMSGGGEPDGSARFIISLFSNPKIMEAIEDFIENRQGLMLGIADGFQALVKLGLLPFGHFQRPSPDSPTLAINTAGRYQSSLIRTRIVSNSSPWLMDFEPGKIHLMPISCNEGRFVAGDDILKRLWDNGQIAAQYVDIEGNPTMNIAFNPTGSHMAIESIISPDGRILGKMGQPERYNTDLYRNIPNNEGQDIFSNAVRYFE